VDDYDGATGLATVEGTTQPDASEPQDVQVTVNGASAGSTMADAAGAFSVPVALVEGENRIRVKAVDRAGNEGAESEPTEIDYQPNQLLVIAFRSSRVMKRGSGLVPVKVVFYLREAAEVTMGIYNLTGELAYERREEVVPGAEKEWEWEGKNMYGDEVNNGVYILRLTARSGSDSDSVTKLVGVLR